MTEVLQQECDPNIKFGNFHEDERVVEKITLEDGGNGFYLIKDAHIYCANREYSMACLLRYIGLELGANITYVNDGKIIIDRYITESKLDELVNEYVDTYERCKKCETKYLYLPKKWYRDRLNFDPETEYYYVKQKCECKTVEHDNAMGEFIYKALSNSFI